MKKYKDKIAILLNRLFYSKEEFTRDNFAAIADLFIFSIRKQDDTIEKTLCEYMYKTFSDWRRTKPGEPYRIEYYEMLYKAMREIAMLKNNRLKLSENRVSGLNWLFGEYTDAPVNEETYRWLWVILGIPVYYKNDNLLLNYWSDAHQYFTYSLQKIYVDSTDSGGEKITQIDVDDRNKERNRFFEFNYALGGLLMHKQRYDCIRRIFNFTMSEPPDYVLLPKLMDEIFYWFFRFRNPYDMKMHTISDLYSFPDLEGANSDSKILGWISKYIALLFIRQFTLLTHIVNPVAKPKLPSTQRDRKLWLNYLDYFEKLVADIINNNKLLDELGFGFINDQWFEDNKNIRPIKYLKDIKKDLIEAFETALTTQDLSFKKESVYYDSTGAILKKAFDEYAFLNNQGISGNEFRNNYPIIRRQLLERTAFADDQEVSYMNYDSFHAEIVADDFKGFIADTFYINKTTHYLIDEKDIFKAIDRLQINSNDYVLIWFGHDFDYFLRIGKENIQNPLLYESFEIFKMKFSDTRTINSFFILKKDDLPYLNFLDINEDEKKKFELKCIDLYYKIYAKIIDLNKRNDIAKEISEVYPTYDLKKSVLSVISYRALLIWKKDIKCVQVQAYSKYYQQGLPNSLDDIKKF